MVVLCTGNTGNTGRQAPPLTKDSTTMNTFTRTVTRTVLAALAAGGAFALSTGSASAGIDPVDEITDVEAVCDPADPASVDASYEVNWETYTLSFTIEFAEGTPQPCTGIFYAYSQWPIVPANEKELDASDAWSQWSNDGAATISLPFDCHGFGGLSLDGESLLTVPATPCPADEPADEPADGQSGGQPGGGLPETGSTSLGLVLLAGASLGAGLGARRLARRPA